MTIEQNPVGEGRDMPNEAATQVVRATSRVVRPTQPTARTTMASPSAVTTAELPAVRTAPFMAGAPRSRYADERPAGRSRRRDAAPIGVRAAVWVLALIFLVALVALVTVRTHPTWLAFLRNGQPSVAGNSGGPGTTAGSRTGGATGLKLVSKTVSTATYSLPAGDYTLVVNVPAACSVAIHSPATSSSFAYLHTIQPGQNPTKIPLQASSSVTFGARVTSLDIQSGTTDLGTIADVNASLRYVFKPANTK